MVFDVESLTWMGVNAYHEARGELYEGIVAVCHVVINRAKSSGDSVRMVINKPAQFEWVKNLPAVHDYDALANCMAAARSAVYRDLAGETLGGADHYYNWRVCSPAWAKKMNEIAVIGNHRFMKSRG